MILKPTSEEFKNLHYKDNCESWQQSKIHAYNVLVQLEDKEKERLIELEKNIIENIQKA